MKNIIVYFVVLFISFIFSIRLGYLQLLGRNNSNHLIENETVSAVYIDPERGYIYDRNNKLLVVNQLFHDVMIIPSEIEKTLDTLELCNILNITKKKFLSQYQKASKYSQIKPSVLIGQLSKIEYAFLKEKIRRYKGIYVKRRSQRYYPYKSAANVLGYTSLVTPYELSVKKNYEQGELIGRQGVEKQYEKVLRGRKGIRYIQKDRFNREIGSFKFGIYDTLPIHGKDIHITLDIGLQTYAERLMKNKRGGIVVIEPSTGDILALVTSPSYSPSLLLGRRRSENYTHLINDSIAKPLYDRGLLALYPPGSPFKPLNGLIALQEGIIDLNTKITCHGGYKYGKNAFLKCHCKYGTQNDFNSAIYRSCNTYFSSIYKKTIDHFNSPKEGINVWSNHLKSFGLGNYLGYDLPVGKSGKIPNSKTYDSYYGKGKWKSTYTISNAIGQGEILTTPIQLANAYAAIANKGYYYTPHIIKSIEGQDYIDSKYREKHHTSIDTVHFKPVIKGLVDVYKKGTAISSQVLGINIAGKTGTAENYTKINGKRVQLTDHSIFAALAPVENPKIAIVVFVENGYWGTRFAAPIASLCIVRYLKKGTLLQPELEQKILNSSLEYEYQKPLSGKPFKINEDD